MEKNELVCRAPYCHVDLEGQCEIGELNFRRCPNFGLPGQSSSHEDGHSEDSAPEEVSDTDEKAEGEKNFTLPWHSQSLGLDDIRFVAARGQLHIVALFGAYNAGKTTFLATLYLLLMNGVHLDSKSFAGSFTLSGWEDLAHSLRIPGKRFSPGQYPHFPPHTRIHNAPTPGLLHLAFRNAKDEMRDYLFTDPPGEWFERWADNEDDPLTEGARWMARRSTAIAIFADSEALAGPHRGEERQRLSSLMLRIASSTSRQRVALVWAKSDISVKQGIRNQLEAEFNDYFQERQTRIFCIAAVPKNDSSIMEAGRGVLDVVDWLMDSSLRSETSDMISIESVTNHFPYRG